MIMIPEGLRQIFFEVAEQKQGRRCQKLKAGKRAFKG
jgi:hypothetical protein